MKYLFTLFFGILLSCAVQAQIYDLSPSLLAGGGGSSNTLNPYAIKPDWLCFEDFSLAPGTNPASGTYLEGCGWQFARVGAVGNFVTVYDDSVGTCINLQGNGSNSYDVQVRYGNGYSLNVNFSFELEFRYKWLTPPVSQQSFRVGFAPDQYYNDGLFYAHFGGGNASLVNNATNTVGIPCGTPGWSKWTKVKFTYDADTGTISAYVNDQLMGTNNDPIHTGQMILFANWKSLSATGTSSATDGVLID